MKSVTVQNLNELLHYLREESATALRNKDTVRRQTVNVLISDLLIDGKEPASNTNLDKAFAVLKSYEKAKENGGNVDIYIEILSAVLPRKLSTEEIEAVVKAQDFKNMKEAMQWFKTNVVNRFDPKELKAILESGAN